MLTFKAFIAESYKREHKRSRDGSPGYSLLKEELNDAQKKVVDGWGHDHTGSQEAHALSDHVIPKDKSHVNVPFELAHHVEPHPDVKEHLEKHGYQVTDWHKGTVSDKHKREMRLGKALEKTGASADLKDKFINDPGRKNSSNVKLNIHISRHPHAIAGMSTNQGWTSCMQLGPKGQTEEPEPEGRYNEDGDFEPDRAPGHDNPRSEVGVNAHYLENDVEMGTHVAYLTHPNDHEAKHPIARIALKPSNAIDENGDYDPSHTVLRPEGRTYGTADHAFHKAVNDWSEKHFPMQDGKVYQKYQSVYNDDGHQYHAKDDDTLLKHKDPNIRSSLAERESLHPDTATKLLNDPDKNVRMMAGLHNDLKTSHVKQLLNDPYHGVRETAGHHGAKMTSEMIDQMVHDSHHKVRLAAASLGTNLKSHHIDKLLKDEEYGVSDRVAGSPALEPRHVEELMKFPNPRKAGWLANNGGLQDEHIDKALAKDDYDTNLAMLNARSPPNAYTKITPLNDNHHEKLSKSKHKDVRLQMAENSEVKNSALDNLVSDKDDAVRLATARHNPNVTEAHRDKQVKDPAWQVRATLAVHKWDKLTANQQDTLANDEHPEIKNHARKKIRQAYQDYRFRPSGGDGPKLDHEQWQERLTKLGE